MAYYIEQSEPDGTTHRPPAIIEAVPHPDRRGSLRVLGPAEYAQRWPTVSAEEYVEIAAVGARMLTPELWETIRRRWE